MAKKKKEKQENDNLLPDEEAFIPNDSDEAFFNDPSNFIDDSPRPWVANTKAGLNKDGLSVKHHLLICHIAILGGCFPNDRFPTLKDKYNQYHKEQNLKRIGVKADTFYKSFSSVLYANVETYNENGEFEIVQKKYIDSSLIEDIIPFIDLWYPSARVFIETLNLAPGNLETIHYYWIYRSIRGKYPQETMKYFFNHHCPHLSYDTFKYLHQQNRKANITDDVAKFIKPYIQVHYPNALKSTDSQD